MNGNQNKSVWVNCLGLVFEPLKKKLTPRIDMLRGRGKVA